VFCVRFFCFYIVSSETASPPNKRLMWTYHWISLFMSYIKKVSKLAYRISVILIANERVKKNLHYSHVILSPGECQQSQDLLSIRFRYVWEAVNIIKKFTGIQATKTLQNYIYDKVRSSWNAGNTCHNWFETIFSFHLLSTSTNIKSLKQQFCPRMCMKRSLAPWVYGILEKTAIRRYREQQRNADICINTVY
jgi:hypothetical protein